MAALLQWDDEPLSLACRDGAPDGIEFRMLGHHQPGAALSLRQK
jgi:hypothetical protein